jgi:hypothetical protein
VESATRNATKSGSSRVVHVAREDDHIARLKYDDAQSVVFVAR